MTSSTTGQVDWAPFRKSTYSGAGGCVEISMSTAGGVRVRDSKHPGGPELQFNEHEWRAFLAGIGAGEFDLPA